MSDRRYYRRIKSIKRKARSGFFFRFCTLTSFLSKSNNFYNISRVKNRRGLASIQLLQKLRPVNRQLARQHRPHRHQLVLSARVY